MSPERRCPLNRGVPKQRLYCMWFSLHFDGLSLATCLFPNSFTLIPLIYVKPCFTGDVFIKHMYKGKGKNACLHDHEKIDASITLSPSTRIKFCLHLCLCFCIKSVPITQHSRSANPTNFQYMGGWVGQYTLLLCTDMQMSGTRILCHYLLSPLGTFIPQPGYFSFPLSISMGF